MKQTQEKERMQRVHYKAGRIFKILCGTTASSPVSSGDEWHVSCRACLRIIALRKQKGMVDLLGNPV